MFWRVLPSGSPLPLLDTYVDDLEDVQEEWPSYSNCRPWLPTEHTPGYCCVLEGLQELLSEVSLNMSAACCSDLTKKEIPQRSSPCPQMTATTGNKILPGTSEVDKVRLFSVRTGHGAYTYNSRTYEVEAGRPWSLKPSLATY